MQTYGIRDATHTDRLLLSNDSCEDSDSSCCTRNVNQRASRKESVLIPTAMLHSGGFITSASIKTNTRSTGLYLEKFDHGKCCAKT